MARAIWNIGGGISEDQQISNVSITVTDITNQVEGETVTAVCNGKTFSSIMAKGICRIYSTEVGAYIITAGEYSTMLLCPYFGQFSTDIYSGVLKVACTESGGNDKTCQVRSCDDNYEFTDNYSLTQTFDNSLELVFLGIPTGKYLIIVDEKYRFYKEITTIQAVNEIGVELKQWLYKDGDQCVHNTGGWIKCYISSYTETCIGGNGKSSTASQTVDFLSDKIHLAHSWYAPTNHWVSIDSHINHHYTRAGVQSYAFFGTKDAIKSDMKTYKKLMLTRSGASTIAVRSGAANSSGTTTGTATMVLQATANDNNVALVDGDYYIVVGHSVSYAKPPTSSDEYPVISGSFIDDITQIYLT